MLPARESPKSRKNLTSVMNSIKSKISSHDKNKDTENMSYSPEPNTLSPSSDNLDISGMHRGSDSDLVTGRSKGTTVSEENRCITGCKIKHSKNMIRCMHCMIWCHLKCVGESSDYISLGLF